MAYIELGGIHKDTYQITSEDIDPDYRLKLTSALAYFQDSVAALMADRFIAAFDIRPLGYIWVISEISMTLGENCPLWRERLVSEVKVAELTSTRAYFDFILRRSDGEVYASGTGIWTPVEIATGRPVPIETICELRIPDGATGIRHPKLRFGAQGELVFEKEHLTTLGDMDFNKHVGNRAYINHAIDDFPNDIIENEYVSSLAIKFIRQTFIGDTLVSRCFRNGDDCRDYIVRMSLPSGEEACTIKISWSERTMGATEISDVADVRRMHSGSSDASNPAVTSDSKAGEGRV